jgi:hypothetical protein
MGFLAPFPRLWPNLAKKDESRRAIDPKNEGRRAIDPKKTKAAGR